MDDTRAIIDDVESPADAWAKLYLKAEESIANGNGVQAENIMDIMAKIQTEMTLDKSSLLSNENLLDDIDDLGQDLDNIRLIEARPPGVLPGRKRIRTESPERKHDASIDTLSYNFVGSVIGPMLGWTDSRQIAHASKRLNDALKKSIPWTSNFFIDSEVRYAINFVTRPRDLQNILIGFKSSTSSEGFVRDGHGRTYRQFDLRYSILVVNRLIKEGPLPKTGTTEIRFQGDDFIVFNELVWFAYEKNGVHIPGMDQQVDPVPRIDLTTDFQQQNVQKEQKRIDEEQKDDTDSFTKRLTIKDFISLFAKTYIERHGWTSVDFLKNLGNLYYSFGCFVRPEIWIGSGIVPPNEDITQRLLEHPVAQLTGPADESYRLCVVLGLLNDKECRREGVSKFVDAGRRGFSVISAIQKSIRSALYKTFVSKLRPEIMSPGDILEYEPRNETLWTPFQFLYQLCRTTTSFPSWELSAQGDYSNFLPHISLLELARCRRLNERVCDHVLSSPFYVNQIANGMFTLEVACAVATMVKSTKTCIDNEVHARVDATVVMKRTHEERRRCMSERVEERAYMLTERANDQVLALSSLENLQDWLFLCVSDDRIEHIFELEMITKWRGDTNDQREYSEILRRMSDLDKKLQTPTQKSERDETNNEMIKCIKLLIDKQMWDQSMPISASIYIEAYRWLSMILLLPLLLDLKSARVPTECIRATMVPYLRPTLYDYLANLPVSLIKIPTDEWIVNYPRIDDIPFAWLFERNWESTNSIMCQVPVKLHLLAYNNTVSSLYPLLSSIKYLMESAIVHPNCYNALFQAGMVHTKSVGVDKNHPIIRACDFIRAGIDIDVYLRAFHDLGFKEWNTEDKKGNEHTVIPHILDAVAGMQSYLGTFWNEAFPSIMNKKKCTDVCLLSCWFLATTTSRFRNRLARDRTTTSVDGILQHNQAAFENVINKKTTAKKIKKAMSYLLFWVQLFCKLDVFSSSESRGLFSENKALFDAKTPRWADPLFVYITKDVTSLKPAWLREETYAIASFNKSSDEPMTVPSTIETSLLLGNLPHGHDHIISQSSRELDADV